MQIINTEIITNDYYKVPALSKSFLAKFAISPAHAFTRTKSKALGDGKLFHEFVLEPEIFNANYAITSLSLATKEGKEFKENNKNKEIIKTHDMEKYISMRNNLLNFDFFFCNDSMTFGEIIVNSIIEQGFFATARIYDIEFSIKIKPDLYLEHDNTILIFDLKTVENAYKNQRWDFINYKYDWQSELYKTVMQARYPDKQIRFIFVLCEKNQPFGIRYVEVFSPHALNRIEDVILLHHEWELSGGDKSIIYSPSIEVLEI